MGSSEKMQAPVPAATVILVRQAGPELQAYLIQRNAGSAFMAGNYVFPGGLVDPADRDFRFWRSHVDLAGEAIAGRYGQSPAADEILSYAVAAVRETFEEAGVLFATRSDVGREALAQLCACRMEGPLPRGWLKEQAASENRTLSLSALFPWSHWITPLLMKRRFDTRFFLAVLPEDAQCRPDDREAVAGIWIGPGKALAANLAGEIPLSPPTVVTLQELQRFSSLADLTAEAERRTWGEPIFPRMVPMGKDAMIIEPWDPDYEKKDIPLDPDRLEEAVLSAGAPFSRIWLHRGFWRPVGRQQEIVHDR